MPEIDVRCAAAAGDGWRCEVRVAEHGSETRHAVTVTWLDLDRLGRPGESADGLVRRAFEFLLANESKEAILHEFELPVIGRYFPEFERTIGSRDA